MSAACPWVASAMVRVTIAVPNWPAAGVSVIVRLAPEPEKAIPEFGSSVAFDDEPLIVRLSGGVSLSATVKLALTGWPMPVA